MPVLATAAERFHRNPPPWIALLVFATTLPVLIHNAAPGLSFHDSGEFSLAAASYGLTHPPGAPTYTLLAAPFAHIFGFSDFARAANCFSAVMGSAALALLFVLADQVLSQLFGNLRPARRMLCALVAPLFLLNSESFLEQSFVAEQYTLLTALMILFLLCAVASCVAIRNPTQIRERRGLLFATGAVTGLAIGNHPSQICLTIGTLLIIGIALKHRGFKAAVSVGLWCASGLFAGLLVFLYLPLCAVRRPVLDAVGATSWKRMAAALTRQVYDRRQWSALPEQFVPELLLSYDFIGEISLPGFVLALVGLAALIVRRTTTALLPFAVITGFGAGMFLAFVRHNFDVLYLRLYGVRDWHLPLYAGAALLASIGTAAAVHWRPMQRRGVAVAAIALILLIGATSASLSVRRASLRDFSAPQRFLQEMWSALPADSIVLAGTDNGSMMLSYYSCRTGKPVEPQRIFHGQLSELAAAVPSRDGTWTTETKVACLDALDDPDIQPLKLPKIDDKRLRNAPVFADHQDGAGVLSPNLLPAGMMFLLTDHPVTDKEIVEAELEGRRKSPETYELPEGQVHRLEREARGLAFWQRAGYFYQRELWRLAKEDFQRALQWTPNNGECWYGLGLCFEKTESGTASAVAAYREALHHQSWLAGPKQRLAALAEVPGP
ncbi:MAG: protein O-mannosyl-transferase family [Candidatus Sumerlaeaceae bacterium]